jgi:ABC-2 type transport system permease protein/sodium transport system permease protein
MILVLMTITGAVYPAIDLTAGERERGTLEALIAAPVPRMQLLLAKYAAVVAVAMLTATANVLAMTITLFSTGLGVTIFGPDALSLKVILSVFMLMVLFAAFFSALLLSITSFARTFKEAQAYLVPLVLLSLAPTLMCLAPGIELNGLLAVCPLVNIVLLARDVLQGSVEFRLALITVLATVLYAAGAISVAAKVFGGDTVIYGGQASWSDLFQRPKQRRTEATVSGAFLFLAMLFPTYVLLVNSLNVWRPDSILARLVLTSVVTAFLFGLLPLLAGAYGRIQAGPAFRLRPAPWLAFLGAAILGVSLWPILHQLVVLSRALGLFSISPDQFAIVEALLNECRQLHPAVIVLSMAVIPAIFEELFFRGYLFSALEQRFSAWRTILISAVLFGAFHVLAKSVLATERFLPSTCMGIVLGFVTWRTRSVFPSILLHACHNGLLVSIFYYRDELATIGWGVNDSSNLPTKWIVMAVLGSALGMLLVNLTRGRKPNGDDPPVLEEAPQPDQSLAGS